MLTSDEINEIRNFLDKSNNPVFLFDDDPDGMCAYLLLKKHYKKGHGMIIKSSPGLNVDYVNAVLDHKPDLIVILDKPIVSQEFIDKVKTPIVWLDHHPLQNMNNVHYYNPRKYNDNRPTTYLAYSVVNSNLWIAVVGCIFDHYIPDFISEFVKLYPDILSKVPDDIDDVKFSKILGKIIRIFSFNLKGKISSVKESIKALQSINSPYELLNKETDSARFLVSRYEKLNIEYQELLTKAKKEATRSKLFVFTYPSSTTSFTGELCNELTHLYPKKFIIVARQKDDEYRMSFRCTFVNIPNLLNEALVGIKGYGGGHDSACGGAVKVDDFDKFIDNIKNILKKKK